MSLRSNTIWSFCGSVLPMLLGVITIPYLMKHVSVEVFGILTLVWALIGYLSMFDFGIGRALTQQVSSSLSQKATDQLPGVVKTGLLLMLATGLLGGCLLALGAHELSYKWLNVSKGTEWDTNKSLLIAAIGIPFTTVTSGLKGVLEGFEDFKSSSILRIILGVTNFGFPALSVLLFNNSLEYMVLSLVASRFLILIAHLIAIQPHISLKDIFTAPFARKSEAKTLVSFGAWMTLSNLISPLMVTADRFVISFVLGAGVVAFYTVPLDFIVRLLVIPAALTGALFPRFAFLYKTDINQIKALYNKSIKAVLLVMLFVSGTICLGSYFGLSLWLGSDFANKSYLIASILSIGLLFNSLGQIPLAALHANGKVRTTSIIHLCESCVYLPLLFIALKFYGLIGAAVVWVLRVCCDFFILTFFYKRDK